MPTYGRILHALLAVGLFATVMAWTGSAGNERASAAALPPPIVTKAVPLGTARKHAALPSTSAAKETKPAEPLEDNGTAARRKNAAPGPETSQPSSNQAATNAGHSSPAEGPGALILQTAPHDLKTTAQGANPQAATPQQATSPQQAALAPQSQPPANTVVGSNSPPEGEPQPATVAKSALPPSGTQTESLSAPSPRTSSTLSSAPPPSGALAPAPEAKIDSALPSGPAANRAPASEPPEPAAPPSAQGPPAAAGTVAALGSAPAVRTEPGPAKALAGTANSKPDAVTSPTATSPTDSGIPLGGSNPPPHQPQLAQDHAPPVASPPDPVPPAPSAEPAPPPTAPASPPAKPFSFSLPLGLGFAAAVVLLLIAGLIAFAFSP